MQSHFALLSKVKWTYLWELIWWVFIVGSQKIAYTYFLTDLPPFQNINIKKKSLWK